MCVCLYQSVTRKRKDKDSIYKIRKNGTTHLLSGPPLNSRDPIPIYTSLFIIKLTPIYMGEYLHWSKNTSKNTGEHRGSRDESRRATPPLRTR